LIGVEPLTRITYRDPATGQPRTQATLRRESLVDYENHLLPWQRAHTSALHAPGVGLGLEVRATQAGAGVRVLPGVAVTAGGDHIVLAPGGSAIFGGGRLPVTGDGALVPTAGLSGTHVLTIAAAETADERNFDGEARKVADHTPRLSLRPAATPLDDRSEVVLAEVTIAGGAVAGLGVGGRRQSGGQFTLSRPVPSAAGADLATGSVEVARLRPAATGLEIAVTSPGSLTIAADGLSVRGRTDVAALTLDPATGHLGIGRAAPRTSLDVAGSLAVDGRIGIGTADPRARLEVQGDVLVAGPLSVTSTLSVTGALTVDKITPTGALEVAKGLRVTGGSLDAEQGLRVTGPLSVAGTFSITGGALAVDKITPTETLEVAKGVKVTGAVSGTSSAGPGMSGESSTGPGVSARSVSGDGIEVATTSGTAVNVRSSTGAGVWVEAPRGPGVAAGTTDLTAVTGISINGVGVRGQSTNSYGLQGVGSIGITAKGSSLAGFFSGDVQVTGTLSKAGGSFKIDHPLDPENRYLTHSFVESSEMKNVYDGVVTLDAAGQATVELSTWFEALNETFRYQLTPIGAPAPNLHIGRSLADNRFTIAGGDPQMEVCWQVTGVRRDAWALAHPVVVEEDKAPEDLGYYLHPEVLGKAAEQSLASVHFTDQPGSPDQTGTASQAYES
jgi:hypothetical protein